MRYGLVVYVGLVGEIYIRIQFFMCECVNSFSSDSHHYRIKCDSHFLIFYVKIDKSVITNLMLKNKIRCFIFYSVLYITFCCEMLLHIYLGEYGIEFFLSF